MLFYFNIIHEKAGNAKLMYNKEYLFDIFSQIWLLQEREI